MTARDDPSKPRAIVCGTKFGRIYLAALARPDSPFQLAGVLARGSARSRRCADHYQVPLFTTPEELPEDVSVACVVVSASINGGYGAKLAQQFMSRGIHVLQEHPLHAGELAECIRVANRAGVIYRMNTLYPQVGPVRRFLEAATELRAQQQPLFIDAMCAFQVAYTLFDILGRALGRVRPWSFAEPVGLPPATVAFAEHDPPYRSIDGIIGGVPISLRLQNQLDPSDQDNFTHMFHRITIGTEGGHLSLVNTHGPVLWSPRPHMPADMSEMIRHDQSAAEHLDYPTAEVLGPAQAPDYREVLGVLWPDAVSRALWEVHDAVLRGAGSSAEGQYHLTLARLTKEMLDRFGPVGLRRGAPPRVLSAKQINDPGWADV